MLTKFGRMARDYRLRHGGLLCDMAKVFRLGTAQLSGYECGRAEPPEDVMKPILFNTGMTRAILEGRKTVTRRVVKPQPPAASIVSKIGKAYGWSRGKDSQPKYLMKQPYQTGDVLWVRETWCEVMGRKEKYLYRAYAGERDDTRDYAIALNTWRPSIHMPREAARIFLRVTDIRAERLREITKIEAQQEGQPECTGGIMACGGPGACLDCEASYQNAIRWFSGVWDSTIKSADRAAFGWDANPWVWVIEFERISKEETINGA